MSSSWLVISLLCCLYCTEATLSPKDYIWNAGREMMENAKYFIQWHYGGAIVIDGLQQASRDLGLPFNNQLEPYLDKFKTNSDYPAYKILHNITMPFDKDVGDYIGLFPVTYLNRALMYSGNKTGYDNSSDMEIVNTVAQKYILKFPLRLKDGTFSREYGWQGETGKGPSFLWADDQYMGLTLLSRLAVVQNNMQYAQFVGQMSLTFGKHLMDQSDGTSYHGYNDADGHNSCCKWGRANGWGMLAHVEVLSALSHFNSLKESDLFKKVVNLLEVHSAGVAKYISDDGRWRQVVNESSTFLETSSTAMYLSTIARGVKNKWLPEDKFMPIVKKAWAGLEKVITSDGQITGVCSGTGILNSVKEYNERPTDYFNSANGGVGAVFYAALDVYKLQSDFGYW